MPRPALRLAIALLLHVVFPDRALADAAAPAHTRDVDEPPQQEATALPLCIAGLNMYAESSVLVGETRSG